MVGYTRKANEKQWLYSEKCISLIDAYMSKFPKLFEALGVGTSNDMYFKDDVFPDGDG